MHNTSRVPNRLANEKSPYLLQHAYNPVNWYPWGKEAFQKAKNENKPIFLSIGYSTCHWCHVMAHESFENEEVADYLNKYFISIKVDKEERPDVDAIYMDVCQRLTGSGGWPLTIFMMPDQKPFFSGTYFPRKRNSYMTGFMDLLEAVKDKWDLEHNDLVISSNTITESLKKDVSFEADAKITNAMINTTAKSLFEHFDYQYGGFGNAPKFPTPHNLLFLLRYSYFYKNSDSLHIVKKTLDSMYLGGIFDHVGYGFSRYSTDKKWLVPHFEKMLYDNGLLLITYLEAFQYTNIQVYKEIVTGTFAYIFSELTSPGGGFYCAQDADSEGVEGKYYVFTPEEIIGLLGKEDGEYFNKYFDITDKGNFEGKGIPNRLHMNGTIQQEFSDSKIHNLKKKVYDYRLKRMALHKDDKILTSWNGIILVALSKAYQILKDDSYLKACIKAETFISNHLSDGNQLYVHYRDEIASGVGHIDDYAYYIWGLIELYQSTFDPDYLQKALHFNLILIQQFFDDKNGGFYLYGTNSEALIHRPKEIYDGAIPSGNSVCLYNLIRLSSITHDNYLSEVTNKQLTFLGNSIGDYPSGHTFSMMASTLDVFGIQELICVLNNQEQMNELNAVLSKHFLPNLLVICITPDSKERLEELLPYISDYKNNSSLPTFYLCKNFSCKAPVFDINSLEQLLLKEN